MIDHVPLKAARFAAEQQRTGAYYDGEVLALSPRGTAILWDREGECSYDSGEPLTELFQLTDRKPASTTAPAPSAPQPDEFGVSPLTCTHVPSGFWARLKRHTNRICRQATRVGSDTSTSYPFRMQSAAMRPLTAAGGS